MAEVEDPSSSEIDLAELLRSMSLPETPTAALSGSERLKSTISKLGPLRAAQVVAGLMTVPDYQANAIRLDCLLRLIVSHSQGVVRLRRRDLDQLLNQGLVDAGVYAAEDPPEDCFVQNVATRAGDYRIFPGQFEKAASHTATMIIAFMATAPTRSRRKALREIMALLSLSDEICERARLDRHQMGGGDAAQNIDLPSEERLRDFARRVLFGPAALARLGIAAEDLEPFILRPEEFAGVATPPPGDSALDRQPLIQTSDGILVAAPQSLSIAARTHLIAAAHSEGTAEQLERAYLEAQSELVTESSFLKLDGVPAQRIGEHSFKTFVYELSAGRFVHVIQTSDDFSGWPGRAFGSTTECDEGFVKALTGLIRGVRDQYSQKAGFKNGLTLWIAGGWGSARTVSLELGEPSAHWNLLVIEAEDAATFGHVEDGKVRDLWRLKILSNLVHQAGFRLSFVNGLLNLYQWWKETDYALVPPHELEIRPPITLNFGTNHLLTPRREAALAGDRHARLHPRFSWQVVERLDRTEFSGPLQPVYASLTALHDRVLLGVATYGDTNWWIHCEGVDGVESREIYETWSAALKWCARVLPEFDATIGRTFGTRNLHFNVQVEGHRSRLPRATLTDEEVRATIVVGFDDEVDCFRVHIASDWHWGLHRPDNFAELRLAAAFMEGSCLANGAEVPPADLEAMALRAAGSPDYRYRHSLEVHRVIDAMRGGGLVGDMAPLSRSAGALAKFGTSWSVRDPDLPPKVLGKAACVALLADCLDAELEMLIQRIRLLDRRELVRLALSAMQAALANTRNWETTARATRAIHGRAEDLLVSSDQLSQANGVLRASTIVAEIAASEAALAGGHAAGAMDLADLQAVAALMFQQADLVPAIHSDRVEPTIHISPTGDVLVDHEFHDVTLKGALRKVHERQREQDSERYISRFAETPAASEVDAALLLALEAEYGVPHSTIREFAGATAEIAKQDQTDVVLIRRSELLLRLRSSSAYGRLDFEPLIDRFTLANRRAWSDLPEGARKSDYDFSRFDRRFSMIARPLLALTQGADPLLAVAPAIIERALVHNISGASSGSLQNEFWTSREMRRYSSHAGGVEGVAFNEEVAAGLRALGLKAWDSAKPSWCLDLKKTPEVVQLGDVDALAVSRDGKHVWVVEAKDLKLCRTLGEVSRRLSEYRGLSDQKGRPDALLKHLRRVEFLRRLADRLVGRLGLPEAPQVHGVIVVRSPQPMAQLRGEYSADALVVMLQDLASVPWDDGWAQD